MKYKKVAVVYDWIDKWGGVERTLLTLSEMFPNAEFYTSYYDPQKAPWAKKLKVKTSFIQKLPSLIKNSRKLSLPFYPFAFESFDFTGYDLVISVTSSFAKGIITRPETTHICYLLTPTRFLWTHPDLYITNPTVKKILSPYISYLKKWDIIASKRPDKYICISKTVQKRALKYYEIKSQVIYPPFDTEYWKDIKLKVISQKLKLQLKSQNYYLVVSRLEPYKRIDIVIEAFNNLPNKTLIIIGKGTQLKHLKTQAKSNTTFIQDLSDEELALYYLNAQALIIPQEEDFGYTAVEAQFFLCPVIAYKKGGSVETVINKKTGLFFEKQTSSSLQNVLEKYDARSYTIQQEMKNYGQKNIEKFDKKIFKNSFISNLHKEQNFCYQFCNEF